jgi:hypothetical protein
MVTLTINVLTAMLTAAKSSLYFDLALVFLSWKGISKLTCLLKDSTHSWEKEGDKLLLDIIQNICDALMMKTKECIRIAPTINTSSGTSGNDAYPKLLKICRFFVTLLVKIVQEYGSHHYLFAQTIFNFLLQLISLLPPSTTCLRQLSEISVAELDTNILLIVEPTMLSLMNCVEFLCHMTTSTGLTSQYPYSWCYLLCCLLKFFPKLEVNSVEYLMESVSTQQKKPCRLMNAIAGCLKDCYCQLSLPLKLPGVQPIGRPQIQVTLYEFVCVHVCGFAAVISPSHFGSLEHSLLILLSSDYIYHSLLAVDVMCFIARWGSGDLCSHYVDLFTNVIMSFCSSSPSSLVLVNVQMLLRRLVAFLTPKQQKEYINRYPPTDIGNIHLWSCLSLTSFDTSIQPQITSSLFKLCYQLLSQQSSSIPSSSLICCLRCVHELLESPKCKPHLLPLPSDYIECILKLLSSSIEVLQNPPFPSCHVTVTCQLLQVVGVSLCYMSKEQLLTVLSASHLLSTNTTPTFVLVGVASVLSRFGGFKNPALKDDICGCFYQLLDIEPCGGGWLARYSSLDAFNQFAEMTPFTDILEMSIPAHMRKTVTDFINRKVPFEDGVGSASARTDKILQILEGHPLTREVLPVAMETENTIDPSDDKLMDEIDQLVLASQMEEAWSQLKLTLSSSTPPQQILTIINTLWYEMKPFITS